MTRGLCSVLVKKFAMLNTACFSKSICPFQKKNPEILLLLQSFSLSDVIRMTASLPISWGMKTDLDC